MTAVAETAPVLQVRGLTKRYGGLTAVKNLSFDLKAGQPGHMIARPFHEDAGGAGLGSGDGHGGFLMDGGQGAA